MHRIANEIGIGLVDRDSTQELDVATLTLKIKGRMSSTAIQEQVVKQKRTQDQLQTTERLKIKTPQVIIQDGGCKRHPRVS